MRKTETSIEIAGYQLPIVLEQVSGAYQATSSAMEGFLVLADTLDEVLALAPGVARALLEAIQAKGVIPPLPIEEVCSPGGEHPALQSRFRQPTRPQPLSQLTPLIGKVPAGGDALEDTEALYDED